jgi:hypothetical protein
MLAGGSFLMPNQKMDVESRLGSWFKHIWDSLSRYLTRFSFSAPALLYLTNILLVYAYFLPNLGEISLWDEAAYIHSGYRFISGWIPSVGGNPLISLFYALIYLPFRNSPFWLVHACSFGRFVLFSLLWLSTYLIAKRLFPLAPPVIMLGFLFVTPLAIDMLRFPSDPLFAAFAGLSLWQFLGFQEKRERKHLWAASMFMGLAALARNDGLVLFIILVFLTLVLSLRSSRWWMSIAASVIPFLVMIGGYVLLYGMATGNFSLGTVERTYENFESGHLTILEPSHNMNTTIEARLEARRVFGTPEENQYSVFKAISRNPDVYLQRLKVVLKALPSQLLSVYGKRFATILFFLALVGILELVRRKNFSVLAILCLWPMHLATGMIITIIRDGHLMFPFYIIFGLAAIGLTGMLMRFDDWRERTFWTVILFGLIVYSVVDNKLAVTYNATIFLVALWIAYLVQQSRSDTRHTISSLGLMVLFAGGLILRGAFPSPKRRTLGVDAREQALLTLVENLKPGDVVAAGSPGMVWAAKMTSLTLASTDTPLHRSPEAFLDWIISQGTKAIYVDHSLFHENPIVWEKIVPYIKDGLQRIYVGDEGDVQVLLVMANQ